MGLRILNLQQGTGEWLNHRAGCLNASDAPAMRGESKYQTRSDLIRQKTTGIAPEHDAGTLARFRRGHEAEASIRPHAEQIIGESLYPVTGENDINGLRLSASSDGLTMAGDIGFEHKLWNAELATAVSAGYVPDSHKWQIVHQHAVFGLEKTLFVVSDGTPEQCVYCWVTVSDAEIAELLAGWKQFNEEVASYNPVNVSSADAVSGRAPDMLPALFIEVTGKVTASNMSEFKETALAVFRGIKTSLQTDQDFADAEKAVKFCKDAEERLDAAKSHALSQTASIDELFRTIDQIKDEAKAVRLKLDKLVKAEKENRKSELVIQARDAMLNHLHDLEDRLGGVWMPRAEAFPPVGDVVKGLKTLDSMRDRLSVWLANSKVQANEIADLIERNHKFVDDLTLVPDFGQVCMKQPDDFAAMYAMRKQKRDEAAAEKIEAERARIRSEEQAKAEREAQAKAQVETDRIRAEERAKAQKEQDARDMEMKRRWALDQDRLAGERAIDAANAEKKTVNERDAMQHGFGPAPTIVIPIDEKATLKLGEISSRLGFNVTADFLAQLGFQPISTERAAKLYAASSFPQICHALIAHIHGAMRAQMEA